MRRGFGVRRDKEGVSCPLRGAFGSTVSVSELELDSSESELDPDSLSEESTVCTTGGAGEFGSVRDAKAVLER